MDYLLLGPEEGEKNEWLQNEKKRVLTLFPDAEVHQFYAGDDTAESAQCFPKAPFSHLSGSS